MYHTTCKDCFFSLTRYIANWIFEYDTLKVISIKNFKLGFVYRSVQLSIIAYIVGYVIIYTKGYQVFDVGQGSILTKVKGISSSIDRQDLTSEYRRVWDSTDYVVPSLLKNSVFVKTNMIITERQKTGRCNEDIHVSGASFCNSTFNPCLKEKTLRNGNGPMTGKCLQRTCEIESWCPVENDSNLHKPVIENVGNFTIFFKNVVDFLKFKVKRKNLDFVKDNLYGQNCLYDPVTDKFCPILKIGHLLNFVNGNISRLLSEVKLGGVINILIKWDCNLDLNLNRCIPELIFSKIDTKSNDFSTGINFRYANYYRVNGTLYRDLIKAYGLLIVFNVEANAGKFDIVQLGLNVGAGLALLGFGSVFMDIVLIYFTSNRRVYHEHKFSTVSKKEVKLYRMQKDSEASLTSRLLRSPSLSKSLLSSSPGETEFYQNEF